MKRVRELTYVGDRVNTGGTCEAAVTAIINCGWVEYRECRELYGWRFLLKLIGSVYKSYVWP